MIPITWSWLAGFFEAEGHITMRRLSVNQAHKESLELIKDFVGHGNILGPYICGKSSSGDSLTTYRLQIGNGWREVLIQLLPYLHYSKRRDAQVLLDCEHIDNQQQLLDDDWVVGFWEGDGSIRSNGFIFYQRNIAILKDIQSYLGLGGSLTTREDGNSRLDISITKSRVARLASLFQLIRTPYRLAQVNRLF